MFNKNYQPTKVLNFRINNLISLLKVSNAANSQNDYESQIQ
jgi:hypothetical protein